MRSLILTGILLLFIFNLSGQQCRSTIEAIERIPECKDTYELVFKEDFDKREIDKNFWQVWQGVPRDYKFKNTKGWNDPENLEIDNGNLKIKGLKYKEVFKGSWPVDYSTNPPTRKHAAFKYSTGQIRTLQKFGFGKYEIRARVSKGQGFKCNFWMHDGKNDSELDVYEILGSETDVLPTAIHFDYDDDGSDDACGERLSLGHDYSEWHTFTCLFEYDKIVWKIDGETIKVLPRYKSMFFRSLECGDKHWFPAALTRKAYPRDNMYVFINQSIQSGEFAPDETTKFPGIYEIDYVSYYSHPGECGGEILMVDKDMKISGRKFYKSITILEGKKLIIENALIRINSNESINLRIGARIELVNSLVTSCSENQKWLGIALADNSTRSNVIFNNSDLENSVKGVFVE